MKQPTLFDLPIEEPGPPDQAARDFAVDPAHDVVLEASAGTGKTRVLVDRYVRLIEAGVDPRNILAITFTRKAAAEMRARVVAELRRRAILRSSPTSYGWQALRERMSEIQISTIDAFCFGLLREFPLEAGVDPGFEIADETEIARFANDAIERTMRAVRGRLLDDEPLRLLLARVKWPVLREAVAALLDRRHVAAPAVDHFVSRWQGARTAAAAGAAFIARVRAGLARLASPRALLDEGPVSAPEFGWLRRDLAALDTFPAGDAARVQQLRRRIERYFLTQKRDPRQKLGKPFTEHFTSADARRRHEAALREVAPALLAALDALDADVNGLLARGLQRLLRVAIEEYDAVLAANALLDFAGMLERAVALLGRQEEFARSRLKLQARYHHLLVDEFQDTSRLQWRLIELLVDAWGEGEGAADAPTSIFVVGDRKQSIYRFRHAEVTLLDAAARKIADLRPGRPVRQAITASFRAIPELLAFVNALATELQAGPELDERFTYGDSDRFVVPPVGRGARRDGSPVLGLIAQPSMEACAGAVAAEIERLLASAVVRDRQLGARRARPDDVAILFRARSGHQYFEDALERRGIKTYVYKGLGFFDAPEVQDLQALLRYLAQPDSALRAAEFLRSRFVRISDRGLAALAPSFADVLRGDAVLDSLDDHDRAILTRVRGDVARWLALASRVTPSELLDVVLRESAYAWELRGRRRDQARENVKKVRALVRRVENRGYATLWRIAEYFETLRAGDESNAIVEARDAVNLMTIHSAKGLEFPIVFVVNLHVGGRNRPAGFSIVERGPGGEPEVAFHTTDGTKLEDLRETEELRRLCYVAVTRARDRLYLAGEVDPKGRLRRGFRSLSTLLPAALATTFDQACATGEDVITWASQSGEFDFAVCRPDPPATPTVVPSRLEEPAVEAPDPLPAPARLTASGRRRVTASARGASGSTEESSPETSDVAPSDRLLGTLVHRLFQRRLDPATPEADVAAAARGLIRADEAIDVDGLDGLLAAAAGMYRRLRTRPDVLSLLDSGQAHYEVPFSYEDGGEVVRGVIDCLVLTSDGAAIVLEFKTGRPQPGHEAQARIYARAATALFSLAHIDVKILYP